MALGDVNCYYKTLSYVIVDITFVRIPESYRKFTEVLLI